MMKRIISVLSVLCVLLAVGLLGGCSSSEPDENRELVKLDESQALDISGFTILRADVCDAVTIDASISLRTQLEGIIGTKPKLSTDFVKRGEEPPTDTAEILVGNTNRKSTSGLRTGDFVISREGNRIYILGGSPSATQSAVDFFVANYMSAQGALIPDGEVFTSKGDYRVEKLYFGKQEADSLKLFAEIDDAHLLGYAESIKTAFTDATGMNVEETDARSDANIIVTDKKSSVVLGDWGYDAEDGRLTLFATDSITMNRLSKHVDELLSKESEELGFSDSFKEHIQTKAEFLSTKQLVIYPEYPEQIRRDYAYSVSVTQSGRTEKLPVYNQTIAATTDRQGLGGDYYRRFSSFAFSGEQVRVDIKVNSDFKTYSVLPSAKNFKHEYKDGVISVYLDEPDYFLVRLDRDDDTLLSVFADSPEYPYEFNEDDPNLVKIEGWYELPDGQDQYLVNEPNTILYIAPGAVLNARVRVTAPNVKVVGHGAIVDPISNIYEYDDFTNKGSYLLEISNRNCLVDGVYLLDSRAFNVTVTGDDVTVRNTKTLSSLICTDGYSSWSGKNTLFEHCYAYVGDNALVFGANGVTYRDMTIGTTCGGVFIQQEPKGALLEDIHIFRADDAAIDSTYNSDGKNLNYEVTINRLDTVDCTFLPRFFRGRNMGTGDKIVQLNGVSIGKLAENKTGNIVEYVNGSSYLFTENFDIDLCDLYVDGKAVKDVSEIKVTNTEKAKNETTVSTEGGYTPVVCTEYKADYTAPNKVYINGWRVYFKDAVINDGGFKLPFEQIKAELRTEETAKTEEIGGVKYVNADELVKSGMAKSAKVVNGVLKIEPVYGGENLITPDTGEISRYTEASAWLTTVSAHTDEDGTLFFRMNNSGKSTSGGAVINLYEEIRKYGAGKYKLTLDIRAPKAAIITVTGRSEKPSATTEWQSFDVALTYTESQVEDPHFKPNVGFRCSSSDLEYFEFANVKLTKLS